MSESETDDFIVFEALIVAAILLVGFWPALALSSAPTIFSWESWGVGANNTATVSDVVRNMGLLVVAILALSIGTWRAVTARRQADIANEQARLAERGLFTDRFSRAVANVSSGDLAIRLGGIDALCRMAAEAQGEDYETVMDMLCAFVRVPPHRDKVVIRAMQRDNLAALRAVSGKRAAGAIIADLEAPLRLDIQEILNRLFQYNEQPLSRDGYKADLREADLRRAHLIGANLRGVKLGRSDLRGANLRGANLSWADLSWAGLRGASLNGAYLSGAKFSWVDDLTQAQLDDACVTKDGTPPILPKGFTPPTNICP